MTARLVDRLSGLFMAADHGATLQDGDDQWREFGQRGDRPAAVLVAFIDRPAPTILLTRRPDHMRKHSGQVAFPGGRADAQDADRIATALREAAEEVALPPQSAHIIGLIAPYRTVTGYAVTPVLAVIPPDLPLVPSPDEVAHMFEVRVDHVFDPARQMRHAVDWDGRTRHYWEMQADGERIWGATAGMLRNIGRLLRLDANPLALNQG
ncbi:MAG: CoA pyrophosphatase [Sphingopyxis sp.]